MGIGDLRVLMLYLLSSVGPMDGLRNGPPTAEGMLAGAEDERIITLQRHEPEVVGERHNPQRGPCYPPA